MPKALTRGKYVFTRPEGRHGWVMLEDSAVLHSNGVIDAVGDYTSLRRQNPEAVVIGDGTQVVLPGFVNSHHHIGLTTIHAVVINGRVIYENGRYTNLDRDAILARLEENMSRPATEFEIELRRTAEALQPHLKKFYADYVTTAHVPFAKHADSDEGGHLFQSDRGHPSNLMAAT
jgi:imidazolonepropionase-like amidohydrolase